VVIGASDFLGLDADLYSQGVNFVAANTTVWQQVNTMWAISQNKSVWVTQSAWPVAGPTIVDASVGTGTAQAYYKETLYQASTKLNNFMNYLRDYNSTSSYGFSIRLRD
jgi:glucan endo-1,3-beta-D-glucosidase